MPPIPDCDQTTAVLVPPPPGVIMVLPVDYLERDKIAMLLKAHTVSDSAEEKNRDAIRFVSGQDAIEVSPSEAKEPSSLSARAAEISRRHLTNLIIVELDRMAAKVGTPSIAVPAHKVLHLLRQFVQTLPDEPAGLFFSSLHDALVFEDTWASLSKAQAAVVHAETVRLVKAGVTSKQVDRSITALEQVGLNTLPYGAFA